MPTFHLRINEAAINMLAFQERESRSPYYHYLLKRNPLVRVIVVGRTIEDCLGSNRRVMAVRSGWPGGWALPRSLWHEPGHIVVVRGDEEEPLTRAETCSNWLWRNFLVGCS